MKKLIRFLVFTALVTAFALPALAQTTPTSTPAAAPTQDDQEAKTNLYNKFRDNLKTNPQVAYDAGKEYLAKYEATDGPNDQYVAYIKKWVSSYDKLAGYNLIIQQLNEKKYAAAFQGAKQYLATNPDNLGLLFELSKAALPAVIADKNLSADAADFTRRTLQMIQAGKTFEKDKPIPNKEEIIGGLSYTLGFLLRESQPAEAVNYFLTAATSPGVSQKDPYTYGFLAGAYEQAEYTKLRSDYEANCKTDEQLKSAQCTELTAKVNNVVDRMNDALARAISYSKTSPNAAQFEQARTAWMGQLTDFYKYRNNGDAAGLDAYIAGITTKPLPRPGQATAPTTTPASNTTAPQTQPGSTSTTTTQPANGGTTSSTQPKPNH
jgi:hypothetical protein